MTKTDREIEKLKIIRHDLKMASIDYGDLLDTAHMDITVLEDIHNAISKVEHEIALREV